MSKDVLDVDLAALSEDERLVAVQAVLVKRRMDREVQTAPFGQGLAALEEVALDDGRRLLCHMISTSAQEHPLAKKGGARREPATAVKPNMSNVADHSA